jgi:AbrB family looped-hinge helix DNA binding protein
MKLMATRIFIDKRGRIVLPKAIREKFSLKTGDALLADAETDRITLRPTHQKALLKKEHGIWVYQGAPSSISSLKLIDAERAKRLQSLLG